MLMTVFFTNKIIEANVPGDSKCWGQGGHIYKVEYNATIKAREQPERGLCQANLEKRPKLFMPRVSTRQNYKVKSTQLLGMLFSFLFCIFQNFFNASTPD